MGLKLENDLFALYASLTPQSNQRGIETEYLEMMRERLTRAPQSNQRGIETALEEGHLAVAPEGLNRTSVGLKRGRSWPCGFASRAPQSNQRGIETMELGGEGFKKMRPQSNQRGIETEIFPISRRMS